MSFRKILFIAFVVRLILLPFSFHSDLNTNAIWGIYAKDFGLRGYYDWLSFGNYARPEYPPLSTIIFLVLRRFYEVIFFVLWKINVAIPLFPSNFVTWFDKYGYLSMLKLPGILGDLGIGYLIYKYTRKKVFSYFYLFNPAVIYLSALWGQTEAVVGFFALGGLLLLLRKEYIFSTLSTFISLMVKATMLPLIPIMVLVSIKNKIKFKNVVVLSGFLVLGLFILGWLFTDHNFIRWMLVSYKQKFMVGSFNLGYINLNAFNFWSLILGLDRISDKTFFLNITLNQWAWILASIFFVPIFYKVFKEKKINIFFASLIVFYASFMFLPRMHERYFYPVFVFFPFVLYAFRNLKKVFYISSFIFLLNLYHWWPVPNVYIVANFLDLEFVERSLSFLNLASFGYLLWKYQLS